MKRKKILPVLMILALSGLVLPMAIAEVRSGGYNIQDFGSHGNAFGINNNGQVVGHESNVNGRAWERENGTIKNLGTLPGGSSSEARAINNYGNIV